MAAQTVSTRSAVSEPRRSESPLWLLRMIILGDEATFASDVRNFTDAEQRSICSSHGASGSMLTFGSLLMGVRGSNGTDEVWLIDARTSFLGQKPTLTAPSESRFLDITPMSSDTIKTILLRMNIDSGYLPSRISSCSLPIPLQARVAARYLLSTSLIHHTTHPYCTSRHYCTGKPHSTSLSPGSRSYRLGRSVPVHPAK